MRWPWVTLGVAGIALVLHATPGAASVLALERGALEAGELWRLVTGHLVHWSTGHLAWDVGTFAVLGAACELRSRRRLLLCLAGSAFAISLGVYALLPGLAVYGGLSGIDCALFALLGAELWHEQRRAGSPFAGTVAVALALALFAKVTFEWLSGGTVFVESLGAGVIPVPLAHVLGGGIGVAAWRLGHAALGPEAVA